MPRSPRSLVLKGYTNTSLEELKWIRYAADRLQAWTWRERECESQTPDKKKTKQLHLHLQLHTKHTEMHHYREGKSAENVSSGGGTGRQKGKTPNICTSRNHLRTSRCSAFSPNPAPTRIHALNWALTRTQSYSLSQPADLQLIFIESEKPQVKDHLVPTPAIGRDDIH